MSITLNSFDPGDVKSNMYWDLPKKTNFNGKGVVIRLKN